MTTIVAKLPLELAKRVARAADVTRLTHQELAVEAIRLFVRTVAPQKRKRKRS